MKIKEYSTMAEARTEAEKMRGWKIKISKTDAGNFAIQCNSRLYLNTDGFIR